MKDPRHGFEQCRPVGGRLHAVEIAAQREIAPLRSDEHGAGGGGIDGGDGVGQRRDHHQVEDIAARRIA